MKNENEIIEEQMIIDVVLSGVFEIHKESENETYNLYIGGDGGSLFFNIKDNKVELVFINGWIPQNESYESDEYDSKILTIFNS